jgi:protein CpxP
MRARLMTFCLLAGSASLAAQGRGAGPQQARPRRAMVGDTVILNRANLEQQVRERIAKVTKEQLGLSDQQMAKLQATNKRFEDQRRLIVDQERDIRMSLRDEMLRPDSARQGQVAALLDRVIKTQRQRVDLAEQEQKELSGFLTPLQRARYFGLEQQIRQRVNQLRQAQMRQGQMPMGRGGRMGRGQMMPMMQPGQGRGRGVQPPPNP